MHESQLLFYLRITQVALPDVAFFSTAESLAELGIWRFLQRINHFYQLDEHKKSTNIVRKLNFLSEFQGVISRV